MSASTTSSRDDFLEPTKQTLSARVNQRCSNPVCNAPTSGPQDEPGKALNVGVAAHIAGAAPGGLRYDSTMTAQQRADIANGIWLCQTCAKLIDNDQVRFNAAELQRWKKLVEQTAQDQVGKTRPQRNGVQVIDKWVNASYLEKTGIAQELATEGYDLRWCAANEESEMVDLRGWETVLVGLQDGNKAFGQAVPVQQTVNGGRLPHVRATSHGDFR